MPEVPVELRTLLESRDETRGLVVEKVFPEYKISFDKHGGEPRNADLAFVGYNNANAKVAVTIEAKADEPFGATVAKTMANALERRILNSRSRGIQRVEDLVRSLVMPWRKEYPHIGALRYQLLTATAGTLAFASKMDASKAVLIVHEFVTDETNDDCQSGTNMTIEILSIVLVGPYLRFRNHRFFSAHLQFQGNHSLTMPLIFSSAR